jgi:hypothetical protein
MKSLIALIALALVLAGCGNAAEEIAERAIEAGGDGSADVELDLDDDGEGQIVIETEDGSQTIDFGADDVPEDLGTPLVDGYEVVSSTELAQGEEIALTTTVNYTGGDIDEIVAFYDDYFSDTEGISRTDNTLEGARQVFWIAQDALQTVTVIERDGEGYVEVTVFEMTGS